jgi:adiponectin receptor
MLHDFKQSLPDLHASDVSESAMRVFDEKLAFLLKVRSVAGLGSGRPWLAFDEEENDEGDGYVCTHESHERYKQLHTFLPRWPLSVFMLSAMACLGFSAIYHLFQAVSFETAVMFQCLDYAGICLLISGSNVPVLYYGFFCRPTLQMTYIFLVSLFGVLGFLVSVLPRFRPIKYRVLKCLMFITMGVFGVVPLAHLVIDMGKMHFIVYYLLFMGACYIGGAIIYLAQVPERYYPGFFDTWFHSHQLWHVSIFLAVLTHYFGLLHFYEWRMTTVCPA